MPIAARRFTATFAKRSRGNLSFLIATNLHSELVSMGYKFTSAGAVQIESKDDIRKRLGASPDLDLIP
jgi:hypothetical protein